MLVHIRILHVFVKEEYMQICIALHTYMYIRKVHVYVYIYIYIYIYINREREYAQIWGATGREAP